MKRILVPSSCILAALLFLSCGFSSGDALATYVDRNGVKHKITRGEVYFNLGPSKESTLEDPSRQKTYIENMLLQRIQASEAVFAGLDKEPRYITETNNSATNQLLLRYFFDQKFNRENLHFKLPAYKVSLILLRRDRYNRITEPDPNRFDRMEKARTTITDPAQLQAELARLAGLTRTRNVAKTSEELLEHEEELLTMGREILEELKKPGADFAEIARERSGHESATNGGSIGYIFPRQNDIPVNLYREILRIKPGENTELVDNERGYYIAKLEEIVTVTDSNMKKYFPDEAKESFYKDAAWYAAVWAFIEETIKKESGKAIKIDYGALESEERYRDSMTKYVKKLRPGNDENGKPIVFTEEELRLLEDTNTFLTIESPRYSTKMTVRDGIYALDYTSPPSRARQYGILKNKPIDEHTPEELGWVFDMLISGPVLQYAAYKNGVPESKNYKQALYGLGQSVLARMAQEKFRETIPQVTSEDIEAEYRNNLSKYVRRNAAGTGADGKTIYTEQQLPLAEVEEQIQDELYSKRNTEGFDKWRLSLITRYQAKILEKNFEVVKKPEEAPQKAE